MAADKINFPHVFFLPETRQASEAWEPRADVYRMHDGWLIKLELAGVKLDDIRLVAEGPTLLVQGTRRDEHCHQGMGCHCMEIAYSQLSASTRIARAAGGTRDDDVLRRRHAPGTDQSGGEPLKSENELMIEAKPESPGSLPVLPLKNTVLFPQLVLAALVWTARLAGGGGGDSGHGGQNFSGGRPQEPGGRAAHGRRPLHRRHQGRHQEDGPLRSRNRALGSGIGAGVAGPSGTDRALSQGQSPPAAAAGRSRDRGRGPAPRRPRADGPGTRAGTPGRRGQYRPARGPGDRSADPGVSRSGR